MKVLVLLLIFVHLHLIMTQDISVEFTRAAYAVIEGDGPLQPVLQLNPPLECCSVSVTVKFKNITAKSGEDYEVPTNQYIKVLFPAGSITAKFDIYIMNDNKIENNETFYGTIYDLSVPYGINLGSTASATFTILDDDRTNLSFSQSVYYVGEYEGQVLPELVLSVPAPFDFTVYVSAISFNLSRECDDLQWGPFEVYFPNGTSAVNLTINITDDDFHEGDESFYLVIDDNLPDRVFLNDPYRTTITIRNDEKTITANIEETLYRVPEHTESIAPKITLTRPSPCDFIIHAQLVPLGRVNDYDYVSPMIYKYTFLAGAIVTYPAANITITNDMIENNETTFQMVIIDAALPFYVYASRPATISTNDNNSCGGGCIAGSTVGTIFATGIAVTIIVLIIVLIRKRTRKFAATAPAGITVPSHTKMIASSNTEM